MPNPFNLYGQKNKGGIAPVENAGLQDMMARFNKAQNETNAQINAFYQPQPVPETVPVVDSTPYPGGFIPNGINYGAQDAGVPEFKGITYAMEGAGPNPNALRHRTAGLSDNGYTKQEEQINGVGDLNRPVYQAQNQYKDLIDKITVQIVTDDPSVDPRGYGESADEQRRNVIASFQKNQSMDINTATALAQNIMNNVRDLDTRASAIQNESGLDWQQAMGQALQEGNYKPAIGYASIEAPSGQTQGSVNENRAARADETTEPTIVINDDSPAYRTADGTPVYSGSVNENRVAAAGENTTEIQQEGTMPQAGESSPIPNYEQLVKGFVYEYVADRPGDARNSGNMESIDDYVAYVTEQLQGPNYGLTAEQATRVANDVRTRSNDLNREIRDAQSREGNTKEYYELAHDALMGNGYADVMAADPTYERRDEAEAFIQGRADGVAAAGNNTTEIKPDVIEGELPKEEEQTGEQPATENQMMTEEQVYQQLDEWVEGAVRGDSSIVKGETLAERQADVEGKLNKLAEQKRIDGNNIPTYMAYYTSEENRLTELVRAEMDNSGCTWGEACDAVFAGEKAQSHEQGEAEEERGEAGDDETEMKPEGKEDATVDNLDEATYKTILAAQTYRGIFGAGTDRQNNLKEALMQIGYTEEQAIQGVQEVQGIVNDMVAWVDQNRAEVEATHWMAFYDHYNIPPEAVEQYAPKQTDKEEVSDDKVADATVKEDANVTLTATKATGEPQFTNLIQTNAQSNDIDKLMADAGTWPPQVAEDKKAAQTTEFSKKQQSKIQESTEKTVTKGDIDKEMQEEARRQNGGERV